MLRKLAIATAAASAITLGSMAGASAMHGGHFGFHGFHHGFAFHHRFFHHGFFFAGVPYAYDDDCYARVWTRWGWRWRSVCY